MEEIKFCLLWFQVRQKHWLSTDADLRTRWRLVGAIRSSSCAAHGLEQVPSREYMVTTLSPSFWIFSCETKVSSLLGEQPPKSLFSCPTYSCVQPRIAPETYGVDRLGLQCRVKGQGQLTPPARWRKGNSRCVCWFWVWDVAFPSLPFLSLCVSVCVCSGWAFMHALGKHPSIGLYPPPRYHLSSLQLIMGLNLDSYGDGPFPVESFAHRCPFDHRWVCEHVVWGTVCFSWEPKPPLIFSQQSGDLPQTCVL